MAKLAIPESPKLYTTRYDNLKGLDISTPATEISSYHAADMLNMIPDDDNGVPSKRVGWRYVHTFDDPVIACYHDEEGQFDIIVTRKEIWKYNIEAETFTQLELIGDDVIDTETDMVTITPFMDEIIICGFGTIRKLTPPYYNALIPLPPYVPNTVISRKQDGTGGVALEGVNALWRQRMISFVSDADPETTPTNKTYYLYPKTDWFNHIIYTIDKVEIMTDAAVWRTLDPNTEYSALYEAYTDGQGNPLIIGQVYTSQARTSAAEVRGTLVGIQLTNARKQIVLGQDDIRITFTELSLQIDPETGTACGAYSPILNEISHTDMVKTYGLTATDRIFYAKGNKIYYTGSEHPNYLPDDNYIIVGNDTPIVGLHRFNGYLVAICKDSSEFTVYMIHGQQQSIVRTIYGTDGSTETESELMTYFSVRPTVAGTGAIATRSFATLVDDPLFLAKTGIYGINNNTLNSVTVITNRSYNINPWLIDEDDLENACGAIWKGFYLLALNNHVYVLDSRNRLKTPTGTGYECYFWDNVPAKIFLSYNGNLFFGDADGNWCKFNTDIANPMAWSDGGTIVDEAIENGEPIEARYTLRMDYDGAPQYYKILTKKGTAIELFPYGKSGAAIYARKDNGNKILLKESSTSIFSFNNVDFANFSFVTDIASRFIYTKKKIKKYKTLQIIIENNKLNERFGVVSVTKTFTIGNFAKG